MLYDVIPGVTRNPVSNYYDRKDIPVPVYSSQSLFYQVFFVSIIPPSKPAREQMSQSLFNQVFFVWKDGIPLTEKDVMSQSLFNQVFFVSSMLKEPRHKNEVAIPF